MQKITEAQVGDRISYERHADKTRVIGVVETVYLKAHFVTWFPGMEAEDVAYRLTLSKEDMRKIGHPVTVGASRCRFEQEETTPNDGPDCMSNSCRYAVRRGGMRVNGPCRCDECPDCGRDIRPNRREHRSWCPTPTWAPPHQKQ